MINAAAHLVNKSSFSNKNRYDSTLTQVFLPIPHRLTLHIDTFGITINLVSGSSSEVETPVPIPNTEVKRLSADDTALATGWENRPPPGAILFYRF